MVFVFWLTFQSKCLQVSSYTKQMLFLNFFTDSLFPSHAHAIRSTLGCRMQFLLWSNTSAVRLKTVFLSSLKRQAELFAEVQKLFKQASMQLQVLVWCRQIEIQDVKSTLASRNSPLDSFRSHRVLSGCIQENYTFVCAANRPFYFGGMTTSGAPLLGLHMSTWASLALGLPSALGGMGSW